MRSFERTRRFLEAQGLPPGDAHHLPESDHRFPDGAHYRIEIPSTEGPAGLRAVLEEADRLGVPVLRTSQGSGAFMLTGENLRAMAALAAERGVEVSLFARPSAGWGTSAAARTPLGGALAAGAHGQEQLVHVLEDVRRAADHGFRSVLIADWGVLSMFGAMRRQGELPADMQAKLSVAMGIANPAAARLAVELGASTINVATDLTLAQVATIRQAVSVPIDLYLEAPDDAGGFVRTYEVADLIRIAAPVYLKFGIRNSPDIYPSGEQWAPAAVALSRERVRRAALALEVLRSSGLEYATSSGSPPDLAVPRPGGLR